MIPIECMRRKRRFEESRNNTINNLPSNSMNGKLKK
jgi:hypothetical protein